MSNAKQNESPLTTPQIETNGNAPISEEDIAQRAYALYVERGGADGHDVEDWLQAERELGEQRSRRLKRERKPIVSAGSSSR